MAGQARSPGGGLSEQARGGGREARWSRRPPMTVALGIVHLGTVATGRRADPVICILLQGSAGATRGQLLMRSTVTGRSSVVVLIVVRNDG